MNKLAILVLLQFLTLAIPQGAAAQDTHDGLPHLEKRGQANQLIVDGQPFLVLGGELHNSSSSSVEYMKPVWPRLVAMHLNTVLLPVAWETIEPEEGTFDFKCVDGLLEGARENHLKLVVLWFGAWKNTYSSYAPPWVKKDIDRFPHIQTADGRDTESLSPFSSAVRDADARAFAQLLRHLKQADGDAHTVLFVQVENEVGVIPESRDHSEAANSAFAASVPATLTDYLEAHRASLHPELRAVWEAAGARKDGTWQEVFGKEQLTDDLFMAWQFATYIQHVATAGKAEYALPMYANAALIRPNYEPGQYNSGGPLPQSVDLWRVAAPALDFYSPDIYFNEFASWASAYARPGNPLFIPEAQGGVTGAANAVYAFGRLAAFGFSPFGIDDQGNAPLDLAGITNPVERPDNNAIGSLYGELSELTPTILHAQETGALTTLLMEGEAQRSARVSIGDYIASMNRGGPSSNPGSRVGALFIQVHPNEFLVVGTGDATITFSTETPGPPNVGIESIDEEFYENGAWAPRRRLNGDESSQGHVLKLNAADLSQGRIFLVRLYRYR
ncbi:MAG TPA: DUF5597 domain-containing protein [Terracidiphilus sp.]|jgi:hypothetical protein